MTMKRLTFEGNFCEIARCGYPTCPYKDGCSQKQVWEQLKRYEDTKRTPEQIEALEAAIMGKAVAQITEFEGLPIARLRELAVADKEGRVVVLPCKVGERWTDEDGRAVRITSVIVSIEPFGMNINIYFDYEDATPDDAGSDCVTNWDYFSRHYTCIKAERALAEMEE
jgi:hypothetical protein